MHLMFLFIFGKIFDNIQCLIESRRDVLEKLALILADSLIKIFFYTFAEMYYTTSYQENYRTELQ